MWPIQTQDKLFHDGNGTTELGTIVTAEWLNDVQQALLGVLSAASITPAKGQQNLLRDAIAQLINNGTPAGTAAVPGLLKVLNVLNSTDALSALSAAQGKVLNDAKADKANSLAGYGIMNAPTTVDMRTNIPGASITYQDATPAQLPMGIYEGLSTKAGPGGAYGLGAMRTVKLWQDASGFYATYREGSTPDGRIWRQYADSGFAAWLPAVRIDAAEWESVRNRPGTIKSYAADAVNQTELAAAIGNLVNGAPGALDTLRELATAMGNDPNFASTIANQLAQTVKTSGTQRLNGTYDFAGGALAVSGGRIMSEYGNWREAIKFTGIPHAAIMSPEGRGFGLHDTDKRMYWLDAVTKRAGMAYQYETQTLSVVTEVVAGGSHYLTQKADRAELASALLQAAPPGSISHIAGDTAPAGWLKANGAAVSRTAYADLFAAIGTRYGAGNGSSTFNLPDLRGEFVRGWDDGRGVDAGRGLGGWQSDAIRNITGRMESSELDNNSQFVDNLIASGAFAAIPGRKGWTADGNAAANAAGVVFDASRVVPTAPENRPRNVALLAIIKI